MLSLDLHDHHAFLLQKDVEGKKAENIMPFIQQRM